MLFNKNLLLGNNFKYRSHRKDESSKQIEVSVVILNYKRPEKVKYLVSLLLKHNQIKEIIISNGHIDSKLAFDNDMIKVFDDYGENNDTYGLHLRFLRCLNAFYDKILIIDDDIIPTKISLDKIFSFDCNNIVGYYARELPYQVANQTQMVPIILTKFMLINKSLAKAYIDVISVDSKIKQILKYGKPWGNGEDILISALSMFLHNKQNTYIQTNLTDTGIHCQDAVSVRSGQQHYDYRKMLCRFLFRNNHRLSNESISIFTNILFKSRLECYLGSNYAKEKITIVSSQKL